MHTSPQKKTLLRRPEVERRTGLSRSSVYALAKEGKFPSPVSLGPRTVAWVAEEVDAWIEERIQQRQAAV
ncbi:MAG: AlpA family transcriptional regulator [Desulfobulbaceae bacterium]|nr:AlpA family transcriptional regulator [Desulfobulbaceae bacterium]